MQVEHDQHRRTTGMILAGVSAGLTVPIVLWAADGRLAEETGLAATVGRPALVWPLALLIATAYAAETMRAVPLVRRHVADMSALKAIGVWAAVVSGVIEEVFFRRIVMDWLLELGAPAVIQVLGSALIFGAAHAAWVALRGEVRIVVPVVASTTILGAALAVLYLVAGRNVLPSIVAHVIVNLVIEPWLILAAVSGRWNGR